MFGWLVDRLFPERDALRRQRQELADLRAELDLLRYGIEHPGEVVEVPPGHPARNGVLAEAWRPSQPQRY